MAWRLAEHGSEVLLLCSNPFLVPWIEEKLIRKDLSISEQRVREHIAIHDITSLCESVARKSGSSQTLAQLSRALTPAQFLHRSIHALRKSNSPSYGAQSRSSNERGQEDEPTSSMTRRSGRHRRNGRFQ
jgi:hypothetical protein